MIKLKRAIENGEEITEKHFSQVTKAEQQQIYNELQAKFIQRTDAINDLYKQRSNITEQIFKIQVLWGEINESSNDDSKAARSDIGESGSESETETDSESMSENESQTGSESESETEGKTESETESESNGETENDTESGIESESTEDTDSDSERKTDKLSPKE